MKESIRFEKQRSGVYATPDFRFVLESYRGRTTRTWKLLERGCLIGTKPVKLRLATKKSPLWLQNDTARGAIAWAKHVLGEAARGTAVL